jgi:hypothetical protein
MPKNDSKEWKEFLSEGELASYLADGAVSLYHYSSTDADELVLDPNYFLSHRNSFSRREYERSQVPRTFFYVNLDESETILKHQKLYETKVAGEKIYNLYKDPEKILKASRQPGAYFVDYNKAFNTIKENYEGVYYKTPGFDVVAWFKPIKVQRARE